MTVPPAALSSSPHALILWDSLGRMGSTLGFPLLKEDGFPASHSCLSPGHLLPCPSGGAAALGTLHSLPSALRCAFPPALAEEWTFAGATARPQGLGAREGTASLEKNIFHVP